MRRTNAKSAPRRRRQLVLGALVAAALACLHPVDANAHPHVFVDVREEVLFDTAGRITAVRNIWQFDEAFSQFAVVDSDADGDGTLTREELQPLAKINVESLQEFAFFTYLEAGDVNAVFTPPSDYGLEFDGGRLTLTYTLPTTEPVAVGARAYLEVFDPAYFVAFEFLRENPADLVGGPAGCRAVHHQPKEIDVRTMELLNQIPPDQPVPPDLLEAARSFANYIAVECQVTETASLGAGEAGAADSPADAIDAVNRMAAAGDGFEGLPLEARPNWLPTSWIVVALVLLGGVGALFIALRVRARQRAR
jgi:ABC-type uncharacterized transport system substrate-binding protein